MKKTQKNARYACYLTYTTMAAVANLSPLLFITFHNRYGISYTKLGLLVIFNFCTQLLLDLIFSLNKKKLNIPLITRLMPMLTILGFLLYAFLPLLFPQAVYLSLVVGTVIFSASCGLAEIFVSPIIAALPSDNPERDMSRLHSVYAWSVAGVVLVFTLLFKFLGSGNWHFIPLIFCIFPAVTLFLYCVADIPDLNTGREVPDTQKGSGKGILALCGLCIFLGSIAENGMSQWCSGYLETALGISKVLGDVLGVALFAVTLGLGRSLYAKFGKDISRFLILGFIASAVCYLTASLSLNPVVGLIACALTGFASSMLWPGTLILAAELLPGAGVAVYAFLAASGDTGAAFGAQMIGSITDLISANPNLNALVQGLTPDQIGFRAGMLITSVFPIIGIAVGLILRKKKRSSFDKNTKM